MITNSCFGCVN